MDLAKDPAIVVSKSLVVYWLCSMFFRFACAITLLTCVSLVGIAIEKQNLALKRQISLQHYDIQTLKEQRCRLVLETQRLASPTRLQEQRIGNSQPIFVRSALEQPSATPFYQTKNEPSAKHLKTPPLLNWHLNRRSE